MNIEFKTTSDFLKDYKKLLKKYRSLPTDFDSLKAEILLNPKLGTDLGGGFRKIRLKIVSKGRSENKGARVITYETIIRTDNLLITFVLMYNKGDYDTVDISILRKNLGI